MLCSWPLRIWKIWFGQGREDGGRDIRSYQAQSGPARVSRQSPSFSDSFGHCAWDIGYNGGLVAERIRTALRQRSDVDVAYGAGVVVARVAER